jgi:hypothetical protein
MIWGRGKTASLILLVYLAVPDTAKRTCPRDLDVVGQSRARLSRPSWCRLAIHPL